jgi:hypothetical protein
MSKELANAHDVVIGSFAGGVNRGPCVQVEVTDGEGANEDYGIVQFTRTQAEFVRDVLSKWLGDKK